MIDEQTPGREAGHGPTPTPELDQVRRTLEPELDQVRFSITESGRRQVSMAAGDGVETEAEAADTQAAP